MLEEEPGFAMALSRSLADKPPRLTLQLLKIGWPIRGLLQTLSEEQQGRLSAILLDAGPDFEKLFWGAFQKPPVNQMRLFDLFTIPPKERAGVNQIARELLLKNPRLARFPADLEEAVEAGLRQQRMPS